MHKAVRKLECICAASCVIRACVQIHVEILHTETKLRKTTYSQNIEDILQNRRYFFLQYPLIFFNLQQQTVAVTGQHNSIYTAGKAIQQVY